MTNQAIGAGPVGIDIQVRKLQKAVQTVQVDTPLTTLLTFTDWNSCLKSGITTEILKSLSVKLRGTYAFQLELWFNDSVPSQID